MSEGGGSDDNVVGTVPSSLSSSTPSSGGHDGGGGRPMDHDVGCAQLANEWIHEQEERLTTRSQEGKSDLLFFLHIPRTAGRTFHFCYLKLTTPEANRCAKSYDALRVNMDDPNCQLLATHDDYSLVERLKQQPRVVTMFRDPVARFLSSYEFAVEVSVRSFGEEVTNKGNSRVSTRDVWPWQYLVRHVDRDLRRYKDRVEATGWKDSIANVYNNSVYTPLHEFVSLQVAHDDLHNGQFLQLLGLTNNSSPLTEPRAAAVRQCLRKGSVATEAMYKFAERRLRDEIDVTVVHEKLEESLKFSSAALGFHMDGPGYGGGPPPPKHTKILRDKFTRAAQRGVFPRDAIVVGFVFKFFRLTQEQLADANWRLNYIKAMRSVMAYSTGTTMDDVTVMPHGQREDFGDGKDGFQVCMVRYPPAGEEEGAVKLDANALMALLMETASDASSLVSPAEGFDTYGELTIHAVGQQHPSFGVTIQDEGADINYNTLGYKFRQCEATQRAKYARLKTKAFARLHRHVDGIFFPFAKDDRKQISQALLDEVRDINYLDVRLHQFAMKLFDERLEQRRHEVDMEYLPPKQMR